MRLMAFGPGSTNRLAGSHQLRSYWAIGTDVGIWFGVAARGDIEPITIGPRANVQENCVLHTESGFPVTIGAIIGKNCLIGPKVLVIEGKLTPDNSLVMGAPAKVVREIDDDGVAALSASAERYVNNAKRFAAGIKPVSGHDPAFEPA